MPDLLIAQKGLASPVEEPSSSPLLRSGIAAIAEEAKRKIEDQAKREGWDKPKTAPPSSTAVSMPSASVSMPASFPAVESLENPSPIAKPAIVIGTLAIVGAIMLSVMGGKK